MPLLDSSQKAFVQAPPGNIRLLAPAGCGKTHALLHRCDHIAKQTQGYPRFLIVTFTRTAADELEDRLNSTFAHSRFQETTTICTLNAWGWRRLRNSWNKLELLRKGRQTTEAALNYLQPLWRRHEAIAEAVNRRRLSPGQIVDLIDQFKSLGFVHALHNDFQTFSAHIDTLANYGMDAYLEGTVVDALERTGLIHRDASEDVMNISLQTQIFDSFYRFWLNSATTLPSNGLMTFDDQKYIAHLDELRIPVDRVITDNPVPQCDHILVDEFQDINPLDLALIKDIRDRTQASLTIIGDDDQAIFEWRGGTPEYILNPEKPFDIPFSYYQLGVNYRSPANVVTTSQNLIANNKRREAKQVRSADTAPDDAEISIIEGSESFATVHDLLLQAVESKISLASTAILSRQKRALVPLQLQMALARIHYAAAYDQHIFHSFRFKELLRLLRTKGSLSNGELNHHLASLFLDLVQLAAGEDEDNGILGAIERQLDDSSLRSINDLSFFILRVEASLGSGRGADKMRRAVRAIDQFLRADSVSETLGVIGNEFAVFQESRKLADYDIFYAKPPFQQLSVFASAFKKDFRGFADELEHRGRSYGGVLERGGTIRFDGRHDSGVDAVQLMTAHRSKGREFDFVILIGVAANVWPSSNAETDEEKEAERRVFYVAYTRAKKRIALLADSMDGEGPYAVSPYVGELGLVSRVDAPLPVAERGGGRFGRWWRRGSGVA